MTRHVTHVFLIAALIHIVNSDICDICACSDIYKHTTEFSDLNVQCSHRSVGLGVNELPHMVQSLDLSFNNISVIYPSNLFKSDTMNSLILNNNAIIKIETDALQLPELKRLDLSYNLLEHIERETFNNIRKLEYLNLANNRFTTFTKLTFHPLSSLQEVVLDYNNIGPSLEHNNLFDRSGYGLTNKIKSVSISNIGLNTVPDNFFVDAYDIRKIVLSDNNLTEFFKLPYTLEYLDLSDNPIEEIEDEVFFDLPILTDLKLNNLSIREVPDYAFYGLCSLTHLELERNANLVRFSNLSFGRQVMLDTYDFPVESISLKGSRLRTLDKSLTVLFELLTRLDLQGNPWHCDCHMLWLKKLKIPPRDYDHFRCNSPKPLFNARVFDLNEKYFTCPPNKHSVRKNVIITVICITLAIVALWIFLYAPRKATRGEWLRHMYGPAAVYSALPTPIATLRRDFD